MPTITLQFSKCSSRISGSSNRSTRTVVAELENGRDLSRQRRLHQCQMPGFSEVGFPGNWICYEADADNDGKLRLRRATSGIRRSGIRSYITLSSYQVVQYSGSATSASGAVESDNEWDWILEQPGRAASHDGLDLLEDELLEEDESMGDGNGDGDEDEDLEEAIIGQRSQMGGRGYEPDVDESIHQWGRRK
ncbi:hypothetical protein BJV74DRAFT_905132 [Russula compacta]|nr:hypothetical protein BJV74DRAFT_905132 [Russula compacta]